MPRIISNYKHQAKALIVQAGFSAFSKQGYRKTTMASIAKKVGVSKADLYHYFPSKAALLREVALTFRHDATQPLIKGIDKTEPAEVLLSMFELAMKQDPGGKVLLEIIAESSDDPEINDLLQRQNHEYLKAIKIVLATSKSTEKTDVSTTPDDIAMAVMFQYFGAVMFAKFGLSQEAIHLALDKGLRAILSE